MVNNAPTWSLEWAVVIGQTFSSRTGMLCNFVVGKTVSGPWPSRDNAQVAMWAASSSGSSGTERGLNTDYSVIREQSRLYRECS
jgi:hypothetical protein